MKVAVVTPYYQEDPSILLRCYASVRQQDYPNINHIFVADGSPSESVATLSGVEHLILPMRHADAGATPRAIGAMSAFSRGYDAVAFLDADNTYNSSHLSTMVSLLNDGSHVVAATRNICTTTGEIMYVDHVESNGEDFCDTNCLFLGKAVLHLLTYWVTEPEARLWSDRQFWAAVRQSGARIKRSLSPTVNYNSKWAWHYQHAGRTPPVGSVWISRDTNGNLVHKPHLD